MKTLTLSTFILSAVTVMSQQAEMKLIEKIYNSPFEEHIKLPTTKDQRTSLEVLKILDNTSEYYCNDDEEQKEYLKKAFHIIDIDKDGDLDLVLNDRICPGHESKMFQIYLNKNSKFSKTISTPGNLFTYSKDQLIIYTPPCCGNHNIRFLKYKLVKDNIYIETSVNIPHYFSDDTQLQKIDYKVKNRTIVKLPINDTLYYYPQEIKAMQNAFSQPHHENNLFAITTKETTAYIYLDHYKQENDGAIWQLVLVCNNDFQLKETYLPTKEYTLAWRLIK